MWTFACTSTQSSSSTRKLVGHSWQASASALSANFVQSTKDHRICAKQQNLTQLCNAFLRHGVLFFARIRKNTTFNWGAYKGPIVVGTLQGAYKRNPFRGFRSKEIKKGYDNNCNNKHKCVQNQRQNQSVLLYRDRAECSFFKNYKEELLFLKSASDFVSVHKLLTTQKCISYSATTLRKFNLEKVATDAAYRAARCSRNCSKTRSTPRYRTGSRPRSRTYSNDSAYSNSSA